MGSWPPSTAPGGRSTAPRRSRSAPETAVSRCGPGSTAVSASCGATISRASRCTSAPGLPRWQGRARCSSRARCAISSTAPTSTSPTAVATRSRACPVSGGCSPCEDDPVTATGGGDVHDWGPLVGDLKARRDRAREMGGPDRIERQHSLGKLTVRERLDLLVDPGTWVEYGLLADHMDAGLGDRTLAADGAITGVGAVDGRLVAIAAYDFTVMAGSMGAVGESKISRMRAHAVRQRIPFVWLLDSAGARIQSTSGSSFAGAGALFREQVAMSGVVPMVAAMLGHCAAGTAYIPALADFVPMVKGTSSMALGGRHLVKAATGEDVTEEEMGGSAVHTKISGVADLEVASDEECLQVVRTYLSFFPSNNTEAPPVGSTSDPVDRRCEELYDIVPTAPRRAYDMVRVIETIVDDGHFFPMKPEFARNVITGLARVGGQPVGM